MLTPVCEKGDQRPFCFNGSQCRRGVTTQNKQLLLVNYLSFNQSEACSLIFYIFLTKQHVHGESNVYFTVVKMLFFKKRQGRENSVNYIYKPMGRNKWGKRVTECIGPCQYRGPTTGNGEAMRYI